MDFLNWKRIKSLTLPTRRELKAVATSFSPLMKVIFLALLVIFTISSLYFLSAINDTLSIEIPTKGGKYSEAVVGAPRFVNPILAVSNADRDITQLLYAGLV